MTKKSHEYYMRHKEINNERSKQWYEEYKEYKKTHPNITQKEFTKIKQERNELCKTMPVEELLAECGYE